MLLLLSVAFANPTDADALAALAQPDGWIYIGETETEGVTIQVRHKPIEGADCLEASAVTDLSPEVMKQVILDIEGNLQWSSADLLVSHVFARTTGSVAYVQVLDLPSPFNERFWALQGTVKPESEGPGSWEFAWQSIDAAALYPEQVDKVLGRYTEAIQTTVNVGSWTLMPHEQGMTARFRTCSDSGGNVPRWAGEKAARLMLPRNITDLFNEAEKRSKKASNP